MKITPVRNSQMIPPWDDQQRGWLQEIHPKVMEDFFTVFSKFPVECVEHLLGNTNQLVCGTYHATGGKGCVLNILSKKLPVEIRNSMGLFLYLMPEEAAKIIAQESLSYLYTVVNTGAVWGEPDLAVVNRTLHVWDGHGYTFHADYYDDLDKYPRLEKHHIFVLARHYLDKYYAAREAEQTYRADMVAAAVTTTAA